MKYFLIFFIFSLFFENIHCYIQQRSSKEHSESIEGDLTKYNLQCLTCVTSDVQNQINNCVQANVSLKQTIASDCAITGVCSAIGGAVLGTLASGLMISSIGVLSTRKSASRNNILVRYLYKLRSVCVCPKPRRNPVFC